MLKTFGGDDGLYCNFTDKEGSGAVSSRVRYLPWVFSLLMLSCRRGGGGQGSSEGGIRAVDIDVPIGLQGSAIVRCDSEGKGCDDVVAGGEVRAGGQLKSAGGARATFELGPAATLDLGGDTIVTLTSKQSLEVTQGSIVVRKLGGPRRKGRYKSPWRVAPQRSILRWGALCSCAPSPPSAPW